jgi:hypothetical protein
MTKYLISFPSEAMVLTDEDFPIVSADSHAVIEEAKAAGVYVFGGGIEEEVGDEDRGGLPLLAGAPRVRVRPGELAKPPASRCRRAAAARGTRRPTRAGSRST